MRTKLIAFSKEEVEATLTLFDAALKAVGISAAHNVAVLVAKFKPALDQLSVRADDPVVEPPSVMPPQDASSKNGHNPEMRHEP